MIVFLMGVSGCGKTTVGTVLNRDFGWVFLDGDHFHSSENKAKMASGTPLTDEDRIPWLMKLNNFATEHLHLNVEKHIAIACSALKQVYREILAEKLPTSAYKFVYLKVSLDVAIQPR